MDIRRAENCHIPGLIRLLYQVGGVHHDIRPDLFRENAIKYTEKDLEALLLDEKSPVFVAVEGETVLGYCFCQVMDCRGRGIARTLYDHVCAWAKEIGCSHITLNVWCGNDGAMKFYEKMGMIQRKICMETKL